MRVERLKETVRGRTSTLVRRHRPDYQLILCMGVLVLLGLVILYAISPARVELLNENGNSLDQSHFLQRQLVYLAIGLVAFVIAVSVPLEWWRKYASKILLIGLASCLLLSFLGLFLDGGIIIKTSGAVRWFNFGIVSFQPAELLKFGMLLFTAVFLARRIQQNKINSLQETLIPMGVLVGVSCLFIIVFQRDMGTGLTLLGMLAAMLFIAGVRGRIFVTTLVALFGAGVLLVITSPHRIERVTTFLNPGANDAASYHITQAAIALGSGGFFGKGLGQSVQAFGYLPEAVNDSIFAILGETFGFLGVVVILVIFFLLLRRLLRITDHIVDPYMKLLVAGAFGLLATHMLVNVGAMTGVLPLTGVTLPFLSFGGTSLLFTMIALGIAANISRYTTHADLVNKESNDENSQRRRGVRGSRHSSSRRNQRA